LPKKIPPIKKRLWYSLWLKGISFFATLLQIYAKYLPKKNKSSDHTAATALYVDLKMIKLILKIQ
jgi:hypothetical protein